MTQEQTDSINEIVNKIVAEYKPEKVVLFGSYAWGTPRAESDVDLLVVKKTDKRPIERHAELTAKLFPPALPIDLLIYTPTEIEDQLAHGQHFVSNILAKGTVMYEAAA